jgi:hypothetical protein
MKIVIDNLDYGFHFEIIESLIVKYNVICNISKNNNYKIYLENIDSLEYIEYMNKKYPFIEINKNIESYDYKIYSTFYYKNLDEFIEKLNNPSKYFFICHEVNDNLKKYKNIYYLTPLCNSKNYIYADVLPKINNKKKTEFPIYIIQGRIGTLRRTPSLLVNILKSTYKYNFKIKIIGCGDYPKVLEPFREKIIFKKDLPFEDYHNEFNDVYCLLPLITKKTLPHYYSTKLTSSISYIKGYNLKCLIDKDLQDIYQLDNAEVFNNEKDISILFEKTLCDFYEK